MSTSIITAAAKSPLGNKPKDSVVVQKEPMTFEYTSEPNDTFQYNLKVNAVTEPYWYLLNVQTNDKFTIVNKKTDGSELNQITITPSTRTERYMT